MGELKPCPLDEARKVLWYCAQFTDNTHWKNQYRRALTAICDKLDHCRIAPKNNPLTVTFPCEVGNTIYEVEEGLPITSYYVNGFIIGKTEFEDEEDEAISERHGWQIEYGKPGIDCECPLSEFGKSLFLTREAAEHALAARKPEGSEKA